MRRPRLRPILRFLQEEAGSGVVLLTATIIALVWANGPWSESYETVWSSEFALGPAGLHLREDLRHWTNDAAMVLFFYVVGLELSREITAGELSDPRKAATPVVAALGGMVAPALIYLMLNRSGPSVDGWAIPMATDIAFAMGILALFGRRLGDGLRIFLLSLAIVDDIGAIVVIAAAYSRTVAVVWLFVALAAIAAYTALAQWLSGGRFVLIAVAVIVWYATLRAGIHPTICGVALGLATPLPGGGRGRSFPEVEHRLHPVSSYAIVPVFALANAGVALTAGAVSRAGRSTVFWGIVLGLVFGKIIGIWVPSVVVERQRFARLPDGVTKDQLFGVAALGGIGFTVALFITSLAFEDPVLVANAKLAVLVGSLTSAVVGVLALLWATKRGPALSRT